MSFSSPIAASCSDRMRAVPGASDTVHNRNAAAPARPPVSGAGSKSPRTGITSAGPTMCVVFSDGAGRTLVTVKKGPLRYKIP